MSTERISLERHINAGYEREKLLQAQLAEAQAELKDTVTTKYHDELMQLALNERVKLQARIKELEGAQSVLKDVQILLDGCFRCPAKSPNILEDIASKLKGAK